MAPRSKASQKPWLPKRGRSGQVDGLVTTKNAEISADQIRLTAQGKLIADDSFSVERAVAGLDDERAARFSRSFTSWTRG